MTRVKYGVLRTVLRFATRVEKGKVVLAEYRLSHDLVFVRIVMILSVGDSAPDFSLPCEEGNLISLASLKDKNIVLYFYPKDDTSGCTKEALAFTALKEKFLEHGTHIIGVSPDNIASHQKFRCKYDLTFPLLADEDKSMAQAYGVWVEKSLYGRKYMGVERTTFLIDRSGKIAHIWPKVKVSGHAEHVLDVVTAL
jgi:thioredoxin-dependent peroxiredoxin